MLANTCLKFCINFSTGIQKETIFPFDLPDVILFPEYGQSFFNAHFVYFISDQVRVLCTSPMKCWVSFSKRMHYTPMQLCYYVYKHNTY